MLKSLRWVIGITAVCGVVLILFLGLNPKYLADKQELAPTVKDMLDSGETFVLFSLDPYRLQDAYRLEEQQQAASYKETFHEYGVLGKAEVKDPKLRATLLKEFYQSMSEFNGVVAGCFNPRHGIRVTSGDKTVDLVICFECGSTAVYSPEESSVNTTASAAPTFRDAVDLLDLPQPKK